MDKSGGEYWIFHLSSDEVTKPDKQPESRTSDCECAPSDDLDMVYGALLAELALIPKHRQALVKRGLCDREIGIREYRTLPPGGRRVLGDRIVARHTRDFNAA